MENEKNLSIDLPLEAWNVVMNALGGRPFAEVAQIIAEMQKQAGEKMGSGAVPTPSDDQ